MIYYCDIDNTICSTKDSDYTLSVPYEDRIAYMNSLFEQGHEIHYWTARGGNSKINWLEFTIQQLDSWDVKYTSIQTGKPSYDIFIEIISPNTIHLAQERE